MSVVAYARLVRSQLDEALESLERGLLGGGIKDMEEYKFITGERRGIQKAVMILDEVTRHFDEQQ